MPQRAKKPVTVAPSEAEAHEAMKHFARTSSQLKGLEAEVELEVQKVRDKYKVRVEKIRVEYNDALDKLKAYAEEHRADLFDKKKSVDWTHGLMGFRTGTPKVAKPTRITWAKVLEILKEEGLTHFIRMKEELDKDKIIESRQDQLVMGQLKELAGVEVVQQESFFVEPKEEEVRS